MNLRISILPNKYKFTRPSKYFKNINPEHIEFVIWLFCFRYFYTYKSTK